MGLEPRKPEQIDRFAATFLERFVDIKKIVDAGLVTVERCWELWVAKDPGISIEDARVRVKMHLAGIETRRPIERIPAENRAGAKELRAWYRDEFAVDWRGLDREKVPSDEEESKQ